MLPQKLILENIGPFIDETIDFSEFLAHGLFLITGKTGAGKSTILDAMSFALFGEPIGNSRQSKELRSNFALPTSLCQVTLEFSHQDRLYRITRSPLQQIAKKRGTGFREHKPQAFLEVFDLSGKEIDAVSGLQKVNMYIADLLQLNRQQFTQIMLLPQGEFRRFLLADSEDKTKLLRTLFATMDYQRLTDWFKEQLANKRQGLTRQLEQFSQLKMQFQWTNELTEEQQQALNKDLVTFITEATSDLAEQETTIQEKKHQLSQLKAQLKAFHQQIEVGQLLHHQQRQYEEAFNQHATYQEKAADYAQLAQKITEIEWLKDQVNLWQQAIEEQQQYQKTQQAYQQAQLDLKQANLDWQNWQAGQALRQANEQAAEQIQNELLQVIQRLPLAELLTQKQATWQKNQVELNQLRQQIAAKKQHFEQSQANLAANSQEYEMLQQQQAQQALWQLAPTDQFQLAQLLSQIQGLFQNIEQSLTLRKNYVAEQVIIAEEKTKLLAQLTVSQQENIELLKLRLQLTLEQGQACPICGSLEHPALANEQQAQQLNHQSLLASEEKLQQLNQQNEQLLSRQSQLATQITQVNQQILSDYELFEQQLQAYLVLLQQVQQFIPDAQAHFSDAMRALANQLQGQTHQLVKQVNNWLGEWPKETIAKELNQENATLASVMLTMSAQLPPILADLAASYALFDQFYTALTTSQTKLASQLATCLEQQQVLQAEVQELSQLLQEQQQHLQAQELQVEKLAGELASLQGQLAPFTLAELTTKKAELTQKQATLNAKIATDKSQEQSLAQARIRLEEAIRILSEQRIAQKTQLQVKFQQIFPTIKQLQASQLASQEDQQLAQLLEGLTLCIEQTTPEAFDTQLADLTFTHLLTYLPFVEQLPTLKEEYQMYQQQVQILEQRLQELLPASKQPKVDLSQLQDKVQQLQDEADENQRQIATLALRSTQNQQVLANYQALLSTNQQTMEEVSAFAQLSDVVAGKNQQNLSLERYVLQVYFNEILKVANKRLLQLTKGRYILLIDQNKGSYVRATGLELLIYDAHSGENRRVQTLSGGESFIVALCLALSLADVIQQQSGGIQIEALFIDEGFGTLDEEALAQAMQALMQIESEGRLIGIISHVRELKEQIYQQLQVRTKGNGQSQLVSQSMEIG